MKVIVFCILLFVMVFMVLGSILYFKLGWFKKFFHDLLLWHQPAKCEEQSFDGCSIHSICKHCGKEIMQDSQGNWF